MRLLQLTCLLFALCMASNANAALLKCEPEPGRLAVYIHGFGRGDLLPDGLDVFTAFIRAGADQYDMQPENLVSASLREGVLRIEARQELSAGAVAELRFEGEAGTGGEFPGRVVFRAEGRELRGSLRCKLT